MKIVLDDENKSYINIDFNKSKQVAELSVKSNKDNLTSVMITLQLSEKQLERLVSALVSAKADFIKSNI